jgi:hypothetical protein
MGWVIYSDKPAGVTAFKATFCTPHDCRNTISKKINIDD